MGMSSCHLNTKQAGSAANVAKRLERREIKLIGQGLEVDARKAGHRGHELLESWRLLVKLLEHALLSVLDFVLRFAGAERLGQVVPELEQPRVEQDEDAADIAQADLAE